MSKMYFNVKTSLNLHGIEMEYPQQKILTFKSHDRDSLVT